MQLYGLKGNSSPRKATYDYVEAHWASECARLSLAPVAARWALWDIKQGHPGTSRYWSYVLEGRPTLGDINSRQLELTF